MKSKICGEQDDFRDGSGADTSSACELPTKLSETGLYSYISDEVVSEEAVALPPRFFLSGPTVPRRIAG